jgi:hypothetical protein
MLNTKSRSERAFSVMLVEELLRAELKKLYGDELKFFQCDMVASPRSLVKCNNITISRPEYEFLDHDYGAGSVVERQVNIRAVVGPFGRLYAGNPPEDRRRKLCWVEAVCRIFTITTGSIQWQVHFLRFTVKDENGQLITTEKRNYEDGRIDGRESAKNADNLCRDMTDNQIGVNHLGFK